MKEEKSKDTVCRRCGACCHLDMIAYVSREDIERWQSEGRHDILARVEDNDVIRSGDRVRNRFGSHIRTCRMSCIYLTWEGKTASCSIYETRTRVCRSYVPGSTGLCPLYYQGQDGPAPPDPEVEEG